MFVFAAVGKVNVISLIFQMNFVNNLRCVNHLVRRLVIGKKKILAADCSVSIHVRQGDFAYNPRMNRNKLLFAVLPIDYYRECLNILRRQHKNLTLFIFSNNLHWCKENLHFDIPTEYVEVEGIRDFEELRLMSLCKHNIIANSTFSW